MEDKDRKAFYKLMSNAIYGKIMEKVRIKVYGRLVKNEKDYLKWTPKPSYVAQKIFDNDLVTIQSIKTTLILNKSALSECVY